jgi:hypothetical protein
MRPLSILILTDGRPGHYHLSEGVAAAIARRRPVAIARAGIDRRAWVPGRVLAAGLGAGVAPATVLSAGYGRKIAELGPAELVISAGGDTLAANVAAARALGAQNIFCGTLRHVPPEAFSLVISSYQRHARLARHIVTLKPNGLDPDELQARPGRRTLAPGEAPQLAGLLVGGNSGLFKYTDGDWQHLLAFLAEAHTQLGMRWLVSTSPRSPAALADRLQVVAQRPGGPIAELIDFRTAGPGTLAGLFAAVEAVLVTEDSSTMLSEAVCARLPVVGVAPAAHAFKDEEREYRAYLTSEGWVRSLPLAGLSPESFLAALGHVRPLRDNHLDRLADLIAERLPGLFKTPSA